MLLFYFNRWWMIETINVFDTLLGGVAASEECRWAPCGDAFMGMKVWDQLEWKKYML